MSDEDVLNILIPNATREKWRAKPTRDLVYRLEVLCACGPYPSDDYHAQRLRYRRAQRAAWEAYVTAATMYGMFSGPHGKNLQSRLQNRDHTQFRPAMAECMASWFLGAHLRFQIEGVAAGRDLKNLELRAHTESASMGVEVKAPFRERPSGAWGGGESDKISAAIQAANDQFDDKTPNVLMLVPKLRVNIFTSRSDILHACFGHSEYVLQFNKETGEAGNGRLEFNPAGKFLNTRRPGGGLLKPDGLPAHRRISAIICIEEEIREKYPPPNPLALGCDELDSDMECYWWKLYQLSQSRENEAWIAHNALVVHNPHAIHPVPVDIWHDYPSSWSVRMG